MYKTAKDLIKKSGDLFSKRQPLLSLWQEIAENFYPQRADFTVHRNLGQDFASHLTTSHPLLMHRTLSEQLSTMLRPSASQWFYNSVSGLDEVDYDAKFFLEMTEKTMRDAMYASVSGFDRATKEADHDYVAFGQAVINAKLNKDGDELSYKCINLRDVVWCENESGFIDTISRKWTPSLYDLVDIFTKEKVHPKILEKLEKDGYQNANCIHVVMPKNRVDFAENYDGKMNKLCKWVSVYIDVENEHILEIKGMRYKEYIIPRWQTVSGSQYSYSPCTIAALPDARLLQSMTLVLLEAGEKAVTPPMIATQDAIRSDIGMYPGGVTYIDKEYDERLGAALRPVDMNFNGLPIGLEMIQDIKMQLSDAFYLNKLNLPAQMSGTTAYEIGQRVQEYIRNALPLFQPIETEYNAALCEVTFEILMAAGAFITYDENGMINPVDKIPDSLSGAKIIFKFESPLHDAIEQQKAQKFLETKAMVAEAIAMDQNAATVLNVDEALRDVMDGMRVPTKWLNSKEKIEEMKKASAEQANQAALLQQMQMGGEVAEQAGKAAQALGQGGVL